MRRAGSWIVMLAVSLLPPLSAPPAAARSPEATKADPAIRRLDGKRLTPREIDAEVERLMARERVAGLALALIREGRPAYVKAYGLRSVENKLPLGTDTVMYGASLTKTAFACMVMQLVDEGVLSLDAPLSTYLRKPLPESPKYADLAGDPRWRSLTARILLNHTSGFPNFRFLNPDGRLDIKFDPGSRYAYSGEGFNLLQFVLEQGPSLDVGREMQRRVFDRFGMTRTSMTWRDDFAPNVANGYDLEGRTEGHHRRENVRAAGSMDTTIEDYARFLAGFLRGEGLSTAARAEMLRPQIAIESAHQFPTLASEVNPANRDIGLSAGLGLVVFESPHGPAFFKGGHDDWTGNMAVCVIPRKSCILLLSNSVRAEAIYPSLVESFLGDTRLPWSWEYNTGNPPPPRTGAAPAPRRRIAVTFDDLPGPRASLVSNDIDALRENTRRLLASIRKHRIPAIGFVNEGKLFVEGETARETEARAAVLAMWLDAGLDLGNHTYSHQSLNTTPLEAFEEDVVRGEPVIRRLLDERGSRLRYFRHPFLHVGLDLDKRHALEAFLRERGYTVAPVTIDNDEYMYASVYADALRRGDRKTARRVGADYLRYMDVVVSFAEEVSRQLTGREIPQVLLLHANALNADYFGRLARALEKRGYRYIALDEALRDEAYNLPDTYVGRWGISWLHHWELTAGRKRSPSPDPPDWLTEAYTALGN